jgi:hypothetical protein
MGAVNRGDLAWALAAVLPHCGKTEATAVVGLEPYGDALYAYASDRYTTALARIRERSSLDVALVAKEATELMRFIRPVRVAEFEQDLAILPQPGELHVGVWVEDGELGDSAVFETTSSALSLKPLLGLITALHKAPLEWDEAVYQPDVLAKFAKAKRADTDRLRIFPRHIIDRNGAAVVTVGTDFIGAIAGLTYDQLGTATVADILQTEGNAA